MYVQAKSRHGRSGQGIEISFAMVGAETLELCELTPLGFSDQQPYCLTGDAQSKLPHIAAVLLIGL